MNNTIQINGTELTYAEQGIGTSVVFVHGAISDMRTWEHQLPAIGEHYRAISYSRRYARPNDDIAANQNDPWGQHVEDLAEFLQQIHASPAHVVGNSQGAFISMVLAKRYPDLVLSLALEEPAALPLLSSTMPPTPLDFIKLCLRQPRLVRTAVGFGLGAMLPMQRALARGDERRGAEIFTRAVLGDAIFDGLSDNRKQQCFDNSSTILRFVWHPDVPDFSPKDVRKLTVPVLFMQGEVSPAWFSPLMNYIAGLLPNVERVTIPGVSHFMHEENSDATNTILLEFLDRIESSVKDTAVSDLGRD